MTLSLSNIGLHQSLSIELKPITILTGENNTGKSTIGKVLYALLHGSSRAAERFQTYKQLALEHLCLEASTIADAHGLKSTAGFQSDTDCIENCIHSLAANESAEDASHLSSSLSAIKDLSIMTFLDQRVTSILQKEFKGSFKTQGASEFSVQLCTINGEYKISSSGQNRYVMSPYSQVFYIDDAASLGDFLPRPLYHQNDLIKTIRSCIAKEPTKLDDKFSEVIPGNFKFENGQLYYKQGDSYIHSYNMATGIKIFAILKLLLSNKKLSTTSYIILDEPEIHLHPKWQLVLAELLVLLQKEFGLHILLTTHSPYFLEAIEVYSKKHDISAKCKFYLAEASGQMSNLLDVTGDTEPIYKKLAAPFQTLENERYADD